MGKVKFWKTFRLHHKAVLFIKSHGTFALLVSISKANWAQYIFSSKATSFWWILTILSCREGCWYFVRSGAGPNYCNLLVNVRIRFKNGDKIHSFRVLAVSLRFHHTDITMEHSLAIFFKSYTRWFLNWEGIKYLQFWTTMIMKYY